MILLLLKVTLLLCATLAVASSSKRAGAALRHLICACGLAGSLLLPLTLLSPPALPLFRIDALAVPNTAQLVQSSPGIAAPLIQSLPWLWAVGAMILLVRIAIGYRYLAHLLRTVNSTPEPGTFFADVSVPVVAGLLRPVILVPRSAAHWSREQWTATLLHERAHLRRKDLWTLLLSHLACAAYWFHPLAWMLAAQLRREQEKACDDAVILSGFEPASYAEALLAAAQNTPSTRLIGCHMMTQSTLRSRIARLLSESIPRVSPSTLKRTALLFGAAVIAIGLVSAKDEDRVYKVGNGVHQPVTIRRVDPSYTEEARQKKIAGTVALSVVIMKDGLAHNIRVSKHLGEGLDEKAIEAVQKWRFRPGTKEGKPVNVRATIEINFRLL
jgi:TonB family protein